MHISTCVLPPLPRLALDWIRAPVVEPLIEIKCQRELLERDRRSWNGVYVKDKYISTEECLRLLLGKCTVI